MQRTKALTKSTLCQTLKKPARQGSKLAARGAYIDVSDRRLQAPLTRQAKIPSALLLSEGVFVFAGFVSGLSRCMDKCNGSSCFNGKPGTQILLLHVLGQ